MMMSSESPRASGWYEEEDGHSSISGATLEKARIELNEDPSTRAAAVQELRSLILQREQVC